jgi:hypothetical protein
LADEQAAAAHSNDKIKRAAPKSRPGKHIVAPKPSQIDILPAISSRTTPAALIKKTSPRGTSTASKPKLKAKQSTKRTKGKAQDQDASPALIPPTVEGATGLFDLPAELRNEIYTYVLAPANNIVTISHSRPHVEEPALLAVNRQLRSEGLSVFYGCNVFQINGSTFVGKFLRTAEDEILRSLSIIEILCAYTISLNATFMLTLITCATADEPRPIGEAQDRLRKIWNDFKGRGLKKSVLRFEVSKGSQRVWANLDQIRRLKDAD